MATNQSSSAEHVLLARVEKALRAAGVAGVGDAILLESLRRVLEDQGLSPEEEAALRPDADPGTDPIDRFIACRVERAFAAALEAGARSAGLAAPIGGPRVVVVRSKHAGEIPAPLPSLGTQRIGDLDSDGRGVLVLADGPALDGYVDRHGDFKIGGQALGLHFKAGGDDRMLTVGESDLDAVHVLEFEAAFAQLELALERAARASIARPIFPSQPAPPSTPLAPAPPWAGAIDPIDALVGSVFDGKYHLSRRIGQGGFGVVYEARDLRLDHRIAIKLMRPDATRPAADLEAFKSEARRATRLSHPNIVDWKTFEQSADGNWYFVMELLEGEELDVLLKREGELDAKRAGRILLQILDALKAAHDVGEGQSVLHLDLKPKNVFVLRGRPGDPERIKVIDFGIGRFVDPDISPSVGGDSEPGPARGRNGARAVASADEDDAEQTLFSVHRFDHEDGGTSQAPTSSSEPLQRSTACTPEYAAPEQCAHLLPELEPLPLDGRADLYALGVIGFQMLTGALPFEKPKRRKDLLHIKQAIEPHKVGDMGVRVPAALAQFVDRCLARNRDARFHDAAEAHDALARIVHPPVRKSLLTLAGLLVVGAVAAAWTIGKSLGKQGLDVFARQGGVETSLGGSRLYLGPAKDEALVRVSGLDASAKIESVRIVDRREKSSREVPGLHAAAHGEREVILSADTVDGRLQRPVYLEVATSKGDPAWSVPFEIVWLGPASWSLEEASVQDRGGRAINPQGLDLRVKVRGSSADLAGVRASSGAREIAAQRDGTHSSTEESLFTAPLSALGIGAGPASVRVVATDLAGGTRETSVDLDAVDGPIALLDASLDATAVGARYSISPRSDPSLAVAASRKADLSWTIRDENEAVLMKGSAQGVEPSMSTSSGRYVLAGLSKLRGGNSFSGSVEVVADERAYVLHADPEQRAVARRRLDFLFADSAPDFSVRLATSEGGLGRPIDAEHPTFVSRKDLLVRVGRENALPLMVQVLAAPVDRPDEVQTLEPKTLVDREALVADFALSLPGDGEYGLVVRVWRYDVPKQDPAREADATLETRVVVDTTKPSLSIRGPGGKVVLRSRTDSVPKFEVSVADEGDARKLLRTPVDLHWDLVRADRPGEALASGMLETMIPGGAPASIEIPKPWEVGPKQVGTLDGTYRVVVEGADAAGNPAIPAQIAFETAVDGPELELARPAARVSWSRSDSGGYEIQVVARDPNGVADVRGVVHRGGQGGGQGGGQRGGQGDGQGGGAGGGQGDGARDIRFRLRSHGDHRKDEVSVWTGAVAFDESWANSTVEVRLAAEDGAGTLAETSETREVGVVDRVLPLRVAVEFGETAVESMHLVEGNHAGAYVFGGRVDAEEERVYTAAGLPPYNTLSAPRSWRIAYEPHEIRSFYLDEREVSVEQYLAFVRADSGFAAPANWPTNSPPDANRRRVLEHVLALTRPDLPVTEVTWEEAAAYAKWVGKRLPSLVEWEYAVRGGSKYRPFASAANPPKAPSRKDVNFDPEGDGDGAPWPCTAGKDVASDTGLRDLCGNVAEWTATPASFLVGSTAPVSYPAHALEHRTEFLDPRHGEGNETMERFWVAGGSFRSARADFLTVDRRARTWHGDMVGFRCAADVEIATVAAVSEEEGRPSFRGIFE